MSEPLEGRVIYEAEWLDPGIGRAARNRGVESPDFEWNLTFARGRNERLRMLDALYLSPRGELLGEGLKQGQVVLGLTPKRLGFGVPQRCLPQPVDDGQRIVGPQEQFLAQTDDPDDLAYWGMP